MSSALVRQALEFVDPDISGPKKKRDGKAKAASAGRVEKPRKKSKASTKQESTKTPSSSEQARVPQEVIDKLLKLSQPIVDKDTAHRIAKRVVKGKPLVDKLKIKREPQKSILFPEG